jgi:hypothetical protein
VEALESEEITAMRQLEERLNLGGPQRPEVTDELAPLLTAAAIDGMFCASSIGTRLSVTCKGIRTRL